MSLNPHLRWSAAIALSVAAACGGNDASSEPVRQIELAPSATADPQLADAPLPEAAPPKAPVRAAETKRPAPPPALPALPALPVEQRPVETPAPVPMAAVPVPEPALPPAPTTGSIALGTTFTVKPAMKICTNTHKVGDRFTATLASEVVGTNGAVIPAGVNAILRIVESSSKAPKDSALLTFDILSVRVDDQTYEVIAHVTESAPLVRTGAQSTGDKVKKVGAGAAIGAIAGRVLGGNTKSTVLGGAIGAAAGAAVAAGDTRYEGCTGDDATITLALDRPLVLRLKP
ncbi:MAG: hypothetical protein O2973_07505 [Gemmatimonadetes bacterium]|nr:hypothetical protein [Gemmatimonadota bacterium]